MSQNCNHVKFLATADAQYEVTRNRPISFRVDKSFAYERQDNSAEHVRYRDVERFEQKSERGRNQKQDDFLSVEVFHSSDLTMTLL